MSQQEQLQPRHKRKEAEPIDPLPEDIRTDIGEEAMQLVKHIDEELQNGS